MDSITTPHSFEVALKAAAWEAQTILRQSGLPSSHVGDRFRVSYKAAEGLHLINEGARSAGTSTIAKAVMVLAFEEPDMSEVDTHLTLAWIAYQQMRVEEYITGSRDRRSPTGEVVMIYERPTGQQ